MDTYDELKKSILDASAAINWTNVFDTAKITPDRLNLPPKPAEWAYKRLNDLFGDFEKSLDNNHEIGMRLVSFGNNAVYHITSVGYWNPDILIFHCQTPDGARADLIQNTSQLNILLLAVPKLEENPRRIGFQTSEKPVD